MEWLFIGAIAAAGLASGTLVWVRAGRRLAQMREQVVTLESQNAKLRREVEAEQVNLAAIVASMTEGLLVVDQRTIVRHANDSFRSFFRLKQNPVGRSVLEAVRDVDVDALVKETFKEQRPQSRQISTVQAGNKPLYLAVNAVPTLAGDSVVLVFHNITQLRELEEMRREFVANVSHELRTPLSIFQGYLETLRDTPELNEEQRSEILQIMTRHSRRLNAIVEDLLTLARLESRTAKINRQPLALAPLFAQTMEDWKKQADEKQVTLISSLCTGTGTVFADSLRLTQVLNNLLDNALKYTPPGGKVQLSATEDASEILISVEDSGVGIPPADLPHVFERFYRVEKGRSRESGGTGLGLSIVKHIALLHSGNVEATSTYGKGTKITVRLPKQGLPSASESHG